MTPIATGSPDDEPDPRDFFAELSRQLARQALPQYRIARLALPHLQQSQQFHRFVQGMLPQWRRAQFQQLQGFARIAQPQQLTQQRMAYRALTAALPTHRFVANLTRGMFVKPNPTATFAASAAAAARPVWATQIPLSTLRPTLEAFRRVRLIDLQRAATDPQVHADVEAAATDLEKTSFFAETIAHIKDVSRDKPAETYAKVTAFVFATVVAAVAWSSAGSTVVLRTETLAAAILTMMFLIAHYTDN